MSRTPCFTSLLRDRQHAPLRHAGAALRAGVLQHQDVVGRDVEIVALDLARHVVVVLERERRAAVLEQALLGRRRLDDAAARREVAVEHGGRALRVDRIVQRVDHVGQVHLRALDVLADGLAGHGHAVEIEHARAARSSARAGRRRRRNPPSGTCRTAAHWRSPALSREMRSKSVQCRSGCRRARHRDHMDDGVGRAAHRHVHLDGVVERGLRRGSSSGVRSSHTISTMRRPDASPCADGWRRRAGIDDAPGSVRPSASAIAIMVAAVPIIMQVPNERAMPPSISSHSASVMLPARFSSQYFQTSEPEPSILPCQLPRSIGPGRHVDRRHAHADRAHDQAGRGLVAAAHQHRAVDRMAAQQLLGLHREEVAVEHGGRLHDHFGERHRRQLDREAAGLQHAALHVLGALRADARGRD